jgi:hypothetical protein
MTIAPIDIDNTNEVVTTTSADSITGWEVKIPTFGKATFVDGVEYGADSPAIQALAGKAIAALANLSGVTGFVGLDNTSGIRATSDATAEGLVIDVKLPSELNLEARLWAEGRPKVSKKNPGVATRFMIDRVVVGLHGEAMGLGVEVLASFDPVIGKGRALNIQKLANAISTKDSKNLAKVLKGASIFTDNKSILELGLGLDTSGFTSERVNVLNSPSAQAAFPAGWDSTPGSLFA